MPPMRSVGFRQPFVWLARGWHDMLAAPAPALAHGLIVAGFGLLLLAVARSHFWLLAGAFSGFMLVAPVVATGLYAISRGLERQQPVGLADALATWRPRDGRLVLFGVLLALAGTGWVLTSASLITRFAAAPVNSPSDFLHVVVLARDGWLFETWLVLGSVLAAPMFASSVVALPLLLDRPVKVRDAVLTSVRTALLNPAPMALWATLILVVTLIGMATALVGLIVAVPWLAHASWHAYRDLVEPEAGSPR